MRHVFRSVLHRFALLDFAARPGMLDAKSLRSSGDFHEQFIVIGFSRTAHAVGA
jgi:hypothetical protein